MRFQTIYGVSMSSPQLRRADRAMSEQRHMRCLSVGSADTRDHRRGRLSLLHSAALHLDGGELYVHTGSAGGHLRANVEREPRICFVIDEPDQVFDYGRFECDSGLAYQSVIVFGKFGSSRRGRSSSVSARR